MLLLIETMQYDGTTNDLGTGDLDKKARDQTRQDFDESNGCKCYSTSFGQPAVVTALSRQAEKDGRRHAFKYTANLNSFSTLLTAFLYFR